MASASSGLGNSDNESDELEEGEFVVEKILDSRIESDGVEKFKIRWKGYPPSEDTWEPIEYLGKCTDMVEKFRQKRKRQQTKSRSKAKETKRPVSKAATPSSSSSTFYDQLRRDEVKRSTTASPASSSSSQSLPEWLKKYQPSTPKPDEPGPSSAIKKRKSEDVPSSSRKKKTSDGNEKHGMGDYSTAPSSKKDRPEKKREERHGEKKEERREKKSDGPSSSHHVEKPSRSDGEKKKEKSSSLGVEKKLEKTSEKKPAGESKSEKPSTSGGSEKKKEKPSIEEKKSEKKDKSEKSSTVEKNVEKIKIKKDKLKISDQAGKSSGDKKQPTPAEKEREESSSGTSTHGIVNLIDSIVSNKPYDGPTQFFPPVVRDQESAGTSSATSMEAKDKVRTAEVNQGSMTPDHIRELFKSTPEERSSSGIVSIPSNDGQRMETSPSVEPTPSNPSIVEVETAKQEDQQQPIEAMEMGVDIGPKTSSNRKEGISSSSTQNDTEPMEPPIAEENATPLVDQMDYEDAQDQPLEIEMPLLEQQSVDGDSVFSDTPQEEHLPAKIQEIAPKALAAMRLAKNIVKKTEQRLTGRQMLYNAVREQNYPEFKRLVTELDSEQLKLNQLTPDDCTLLQLCAKRQDKPSRANCRIMKILIERCNALKYENTLGANPAIFSVCKSGSPCCLRTLLVFEQIDVNATGENGETALFGAIRRRNKRMVRDLINNGACMNKRNAQNMSAMDLIKELLKDEPIDPTLLKIHQEMSAIYNAINQAIGELTKSILEHQCDQIVPIFDFHLVTRMNEIGHLEPASQQDERPIGIIFDYPPVHNLDDDGDLNGSIAILVMYVIRFEPGCYTMSRKQAVDKKRLVCCNGSFENDIGRGCKNTIFSLSHTKSDGMNRLNITSENQLGRKEALVFRGYRVRVKTSAVADARSDNPSAPAQSVSSVSFANPNYSSESEDDEDSNDDSSEVTTGETHDERHESGEEDKEQLDQDEDNRMDLIEEGVVGDQPLDVRNVEQVQSGQEEAEVQMEEEVRVEESMQDVRLGQVDDGNDSDGSESDDYEEEQGIGEAAGYDCIRQLVREMVDIIELSSEGPGSVEHRLAIDDDLE